MGVDDDGELGTGHHVVMLTALGKGLVVLEAVASAPGPVRVSHLATELDMQKSSVHRVLQTLVDEGWVVQDPQTDLYSATLKLWELGTAVANRVPLKQAATPVLHELHRRTGDTVSLTVRDGDDVLYLDKVLSPRPVGFTTRVGSRVPAPLTVGGRAMLAYEDDAAATVERVAAALPEGALDVARALADIERARTDGYVVGRGRAERGIVGVAAAVPGPGGRAVAGLTVSSPANETEKGRRDEVVEALLAAAATLGEAVGRG